MLTMGIVDLLYKGDPGVPLAGSGVSADSICVQCQSTMGAIVSVIGFQCGRIPYVFVCASRQKSNIIKTSYGDIGV